VKPTLVLASASPRRRELLAGLGITCGVRPAHVPETPAAGESPRTFAERLARSKAAAVASDQELVLGADTVVAVDRELLGKPTNTEHARAMLQRLQGRRHQVYTGVAIVEGTGGRTVSAVAETEVRFGPMSTEEIDWYVATGEPLDKAGAYAIQGLGALFVASISGSYSNVVGLPLALTRKLLLEIGWDLREFRG